MVLEVPLITFFGLEDDFYLYSNAIKPPSCGGTETFKYLALIGDKILDLSLIEIITQGKPLDSGFLTKEMKKFHNEDTLYDIALYLELDKLMKPTNNLAITKGDLKESIEALLGACFKLHRLEKAREIVFIISQTIESTFIALDINYIGQLQEYAQKNKFPEPEYNYSDNLGSPHEPIFYCTIKFLDKELTSEAASKKDKAKKNSAYKMLLELEMTKKNSTQE